MAGSQFLHDTRKSNFFNIAAVLILFAYSFISGGADFFHHHTLIEGFDSSITISSGQYYSLQNAGKRGLSIDQSAGQERDNDFCAACYWNSNSISTFFILFLAIYFVFALRVTSRYKTSPGQPRLSPELPRGPPDFPS
jgi:hypothetical protein